ncbi:MAG: FecR family protein [Stenotrophobium sp.]
MALSAWAQQDDSSPEQAGAVALAQGEVTATDASGQSRELRDGDDIYAGDTIATGADSYADLDFTDDGAMTLRPDSRFAIQRYHYDAAAHPEDGSTPEADDQPDAPESAFFSLLKGGFRAVSGLIGHINRDEYQVNTPTVTIGIRGTGYDVRYCQDDCADVAGANQPAPANGLYTGVNKGAIALKNEAGETTTVNKGEYLRQLRGQRSFERMTHPPRALRRMGLPPKLRARAQQNRARLRMRRRQEFHKLRARRLRQRVRQKQKPPHPAHPGKAQHKAGRDCSKTKNPKLCEKRQARGQREEEPRAQERRGRR